MHLVKVRYIESTVCILSMRWTPDVCFYIHVECLNVDDEGPYPYKYGCNGLAIIISNSFNGEYACTENDEKLLETTFKAMGYRVQMETNKSAADMTSIFETIRDSQKEKHDNSFVCCISSYSGFDQETRKDYILGNDGSRFYLFDEAYKNLNSVDCEALRGIPKLFFVNACHFSGEEVADGNPSQISHLSKHSDFFFSYVTSPKSVAYRHDSSGGNVEMGAVYINELCSGLHNYSSRINLTTIILSVHQSLQATHKEPIDEEETHQCPQVVTTLRGPFFFTRKAMELFTEYNKQCQI